MDSGKYSTANCMYVCMYICMYVIGSFYVVRYSSRQRARSTFPLMEKKNGRARPAVDENIPNQSKGVQCIYR